MMAKPLEEKELINSAKAAALLGVHPSTIVRWAELGQLRCFKTVGGHRRYRRSEVLKLKGQ